MSNQGLVGVYGPSHWACMAQKMAEVFDAAAKNGFIRKEDVPAGVLKDASEFCGLVLEGRSICANPPASSVARFLAYKAASKRTASDYPPDPEKIFLGCALVVVLAGDRVRGLGAQNLVPIFESMSGFFHELHLMGEEEASAKALGYESRE